MFSVPRRIHGVFNEVECQRGLGDTKAKSLREQPGVNAHPGVHDKPGIFEQPGASPPVST